MSTECQRHSDEDVLEAHNQTNTDYPNNGLIKFKCGLDIIAQKIKKDFPSL